MTRMAALRSQQSGNLTVNNQQFIPGEFLDDLMDQRIASQSCLHREAEFMHVGSIPAIVVEKWLREGFNVFQASLPEIVKRIKSEDMNGLLATSKRV